MRALAHAILEHVLRLAQRRLDAMPLRDLLTQRARALFDQLRQRALALLQMTHAPPPQPRRARQRDKADETVEPIRVVERRADDDGERDAGLIPDAVVIGGDHLEAIAAARHVRVVGDAARARFDPVAIVAFEPVAEADALRHRVAQRRVVEFELLLTPAADRCRR